MNKKLNINPTPYSDLNEVLCDFVKNVQEILLKNLVGIYLQGSFAVGDFDENSDCDFIVVTEKEITKEELRKLEKIHKKIYKEKPPWGQHLEGSYFLKNIIKSTKYCKKKVWYLDHGSTNFEKSDHCNKIHVRWVLYNKGIVLYGPSPKKFINKINTNELKKEIYNTIQNWGKEILEQPKKYNNYFYQTFIVLNYCRMLHDLKNGTNESKLAGANWAKKNLDSKWKNLIDKTWLGRIDPAKTVKQKADQKDFKKTLEFVSYIMKESKKIYN